MAPNKPGFDLFLWVLGAALITALFKTGQVMNEHQAAIDTLREASHGPRVADATAHFNQLLQILSNAKLPSDLNTLAINWLNINMNQLPSISDWNEFIDYLSSLNYNGDGLGKLGDSLSKFFPPKGGSGPGGTHLIPK